MVGNGFVRTRRPSSSPLELAFSAVRLATLSRSLSISKAMRSMDSFPASIFEKSEYVVYDSEEVLA